LIKYFYSPFEYLHPTRWRSVSAVATDSVMVFSAVFENAQRAEKEFRETGCGLLCAYIRL